MTRAIFTERTRMWNWLALIALAICFGMIFIYAPTERTMGYVQRLFYFHVGAGWVAAVTLLVALISGIAYLRTSNILWDQISEASVEIGIVFMMMNIVSGSIWGRPAWNTYWLWSPRLTSITIMWLTYIAYLLLRYAIDDPERKRRFASVYVIAAFITVIVTYTSIRILRDIHPVMFGDALESAKGAEQGLQDFSGVDSIRMVITLNATVVGFTIIYLAWIANRLKLAEIKERAQIVKQKFLLRLSDQS